MQATMRAAVFQGAGHLEIKTIPVPELQTPWELLVQVEACSVCGTDVHIMSVPPEYPAKVGTVLGHELVGRVVEVGAGVTSLSVGDRVVCNPNAYCGTCKFCRNNLPNLCENIIPLGIEADGGFAEYVRLTEPCAYCISSQLSSETAMFAEPLACLLNATNKVKITPGGSVLVIGAGPIGLMVVQLMKAAGAGIIMVSETSPIRREYALKCGADTLINPATEELTATVLGHTQVGADCVIDMTGTQLAAAVDAVRKGGTVLLFGVNTKSTVEFRQSCITQKQVTVQGAWLANASFLQAIQLLESGLLPLQQLATHRYPLEQLSEALGVLRDGTAVKVLIDPRMEGDATNAV